MKKGMVIALCVVLVLAIFFIVEVLVPEKLLAGFQVSDTNDASCGSNNIPVTMKAGEKKIIYIDVNNLGSAVWNSTIIPNAYSLGYEPLHGDPNAPLVWGINSARVFLVCTSDVNSCLTNKNSWAYLGAGKDVDGSDNWYRFMLEIIAPSAPGTYSLKFKMIQEGVGWFGATCGGDVVVTRDAPTTDSFLIIGYDDNTRITEICPQGYFDAGAVHSDTGGKAYNYNSILRNTGPKGGWIRLCTKKDSSNELLSKFVVTVDDSKPGVTVGCGSGYEPAGAVHSNTAASGSVTSGWATLCSKKDSSGNFENFLIIDFDDTTHDKSFCPSGYTWAGNIHTDTSGNNAAGQMISKGWFGMCSKTSATITPPDEVVLFSEDFEDIAQGTFPSDWGKYLENNEGETKVEYSAQSSDPLIGEDNKILKVQAVGKQVVAATPKIEINKDKNHELSNLLKVNIQAGTFYVKVYCFNDAGVWIDSRDIPNGKYTSSINTLTTKTYNFVPKDVCGDNVGVIGIAYKWHDVGGGEERGTAYIDDIVLKEKAATVTPPGECTDSDGGKNYYEKGRCTDGTITDWGYADDWCGTEDYVGVLAEYSCENNLCKETLYTCPRGCSDGACLSVGGVGAVCAKDSAKKITAEVGPGLRVRNADGKVYYCDPATLNYVESKALNAGCTSDFECESNVCIDGNCTSIREELRAQTGLLQRIWCAISNPVDFLKRDATGEDATNNDYLRCITPPSLTVTSPNGGENWERGKTYNITWTYEGINYVNISIKGYNQIPPSEWEFAARVPANQTIYSFTVPSNALLHSRFKIKISQHAGNLADESDNFFSIYAPPLPPPPIPCSTNNDCPSATDRVCNSQGQACTQTTNYKCENSLCVVNGTPSVTGCSNCPYGCSAGVCNPPGPAGGTGTCQSATSDPEINCASKTTQTSCEAVTGCIWNPTGG